MTNLDDIILKMKSIANDCYKNNWPGYAGVIENAWRALEEYGPRVLTLDEIERFGNDDVGFYIQNRKPVKSILIGTYYGRWKQDEHSESFMLISLVGKQGPMFYSINDYGKTWVAWNYKPSNKQQDEVEWRE